MVAEVQIFLFLSNKIQTAIQGNNNQVFSGIGHVHNRIERQWWCSEREVDQG